MFLTCVLLGLSIILCIKWIRMENRTFVSEIPMNMKQFLPLDWLSDKMRGSQRYCSVVQKGNRRLQLFERLGVPGPGPSFLLGNMAEFETKGFKYLLETWTKKYGKVFGYYEGTDPVLVVSDPELVKQITVKEFHKFHSHKPTTLDFVGEERQDIFCATGNRWKRLRSITSLSFTARRMKEMSPLINKSVTDLIDLFKERCEAGKAFDIHGDFGRLTTDVISNCAFRIDSGCIQDENSRFLIESRKIFDSMEKLPLRLRIILPIMLLFPDFIRRLRYFTFFDLNLTLNFGWLYAAAKQVIRQRQRNEDERRVDMVNLMLDANKALKKGRHIVEDEEEPKSGISRSQISEDQQKLKPLSETEMQAQMILFLLAGYETTSSALSFTGYELALNVHVQRKLQEEIDNYFPAQDIEPDYTIVQKLPYMEAVMKEALRIHPILPLATARKCFVETKLGNITVPEGMLIQLNMDDLHLNPDLWGKHDPQKFVPERFLEDCQDAHNNMAWIPFGAGPRFCLGMRFAQMEYKVAMVRLLKKFNIKRCDATKVPCPAKKNGINGPSEGVYIVLEKRSQN